MWIDERAGRGVVKGGASSTSLGVEEERLRAWVERLAVPRHRVRERRANARVRDMLASELERLGLRVEVQGPFENVVALPPLGPREEVTLLAAHYDSVPGTPGADDNASGLAVMLECARVLAGVPGVRVGCVAFNGEEDGLLGSRDFVAHALPVSGLRLRAVHVLEMVGYRGREAQRLPLPWVPGRLRVPDYVGVLTKGRMNRLARDLAGLDVAPELRVLAARTWGPLHRLLPDLTRSDHFPFWLAGAPAALWTDTGNFRNPNYHQPTDRPDTLDYAFMRGVADVLVWLLSRDRARAG